MGFLKSIFGGDSEPKEEKVLPWIALTSISQLDSIAQKSNEKVQVIFKHSTRCGISRMVINQFVDQYDIETPVDLYYLDLLNYRDVSQNVGYKFQVLHESPQLLVIKNGQTLAHASHGAINSIDLTEFVF